MKGAHDDRRYEAGDTIKLEIVLAHKANLNEVRVLFEHTHGQHRAASGGARPTLCDL